MCAPKGKSNKQKLCTLGPLRANGKTGHPPNSGTRAGVNVGLKEEPANGDKGLKDRMACLTNEQLQHILRTVQNTSSSQHTPEDQDTQGGSLLTKPQHTTENEKLKIPFFVRRENGPKICFFDEWRSKGGTWKRNEEWRRKRSKGERWKGNDE